MFGEWYQKTNKTGYKNKTNFIGLQNNRHPSQHIVGNVHKASGKLSAKAESGGNSLPTFRVNLKVPYSSVFKNYVASSSNI
jgi:hypothetical protein